MRGTRDGRRGSPQYSKQPRERLRGVGEPQACSAHTPESPGRPAPQLRTAQKAPPVSWFCVSSGPYTSDPRLPPEPLDPTPYPSATTPSRAAAGGTLSGAAPEATSDAEARSSSCTPDAPGAGSPVSATLPLPLPLPLPPWLFKASEKQKDCSLEGLKYTKKQSSPPPARATRRGGGREGQAEGLKRGGPPSLQVHSTMHYSDLHA